MHQHQYIMLEIALFSTTLGDFFKTQIQGSIQFYKILLEVTAGRKH